jgi:hypothetical protein
MRRRGRRASPPKSALAGQAVYPVARQIAEARSTHWTLRGPRPRELGFTAATDLKAGLTGRSSGIEAGWLAW